MTRREELEMRVAELRDNAHRSGKQGPGTHRSINTSGRVGALYMQAVRKLEAFDALIAQEGQEQSARFDENNLDVVQLMGVRE